MQKGKLRNVEDAMVALQEAINELKERGNDRSSYDMNRVMMSYDSGRLTAEVRRRSMDLTHTLADFRNPNK